MSNPMHEWDNPVHLSFFEYDKDGNIVGYEVTLSVSTLNALSTAFIRRFTVVSGKSVVIVLSALRNA